MKLVAGAKMNKAEQLHALHCSYQIHCVRFSVSVIAAEDSIEHPLLALPENTQDVLLVVHSSDRGFCGSFNAQITKFALQKKAELRSRNKDGQVLGFGRKISRP